MGLLDFLTRRGRTVEPERAELLARLRARIPGDGSAGLLPAPGGDAEADEERRLGERFAAELHAWGAREPLGLGRRGAAVASAARRRAPDELAEALDGVAVHELPSLLAALRERTDLDRAALAETARLLAARAGRLPLLGAALACVSLAPRAGDVPLLLDAGRCEALAGIAALALEALPDGRPEALLALARVSTGLGRALALERLALVAAEGDGELPPERAAHALRLAAEIADPAARAYAAVPLLEIGGVAPLLRARPELAEAVAACLEAAARGGWNGGPGPGLGRMPGGLAAAEAMLDAAELAPELRRRAALAVLEAHPPPPGPARLRAEEVARRAPDAAG